LRRSHPRSDLEKTKLLDGLSGADLIGVRYDTDHVCLPGTRQHLLDDIVSWVHTSDSGRLLWLSGSAGTGKSSVANSLAEAFDNVGRLGASFRFNRDISRLNTPDYFFSNIAYQLAYFDKRLRSEVIACLQRYGNMSGFSFRDQASKFILAAANAVDLVGPVVLVVDAFDESGSVDLRRPLLLALTTVTEHLPSYLKIIITSRDEHDIRKELGDFSTERSINQAFGTTDDILSYIRHEMMEIRKNQRRLPTDWPGPQQQLANKASGLFIWASVACKFLYDRDVLAQLSILLDVDNRVGSRVTTPLDALDNLYLRILQAAYKTNPPSSLEEFRYVVGSLLLTKDPLTQEGLDTLLGLGPNTIKQPIVLSDGTIIKLSTSDLIISSLRSLLRIDAAEIAGTKGGLLRVLHPSVFDFFISSIRCTDRRFLIDSSTTGYILAFRCLCLLNENLTMDICNIADYFAINSDIPNLADRVNRNIPEALRYACCFVIQHLLDLPSMKGSSFSAAFDTFLSEHLLQWMEVMSLLGEVSSAGTSLRLLMKWVEVRMHR
jgi:hypothetical protein